MYSQPLPWLFMCYLLRAIVVLLGRKCLLSDKYSVSCPSFDSQPGKTTIPYHSMQFIRGQSVKDQT